jgi:class 3 adenylate cyclase
MDLTTINHVGEALEQGEKLHGSDLYRIWEARRPVRLPGKPEKHSYSEGSTAQIPWMEENFSYAVAFSEAALKKEEFLLVCDACREATLLWQKDSVDPAQWVRLNSHLAAAKMRLGFTRDARHTLEPLLDDARLESNIRAQILHQLGDIVREESHHTAALAARKQAAEDARNFYRRAREVDPQLLEAHLLHAVMSLLLSEKGTPQREAAAVLGRQVLSQIQGVENSAGANFNSTWFKAFAVSVIGDPEKAYALYEKLQTLPDATTSKLADVRFRAHFIAEAMDLKLDYFKKAFPRLELIVFAGHNIDLPLADPSDTAPRFPRENMDLVRDLLRRKLAAMDARVGLVSAAAGADLLFIEALQERGAKYHVVLPWSEAEFRRSSVEPFEEPGAEKFWTPLFDRALKNSATVRELGQVFEPSGDVGWEFSKEVSAGLALLTARLSRLDVQPMALWDGKIGRGAGGTAAFVQFWSNYLQQEPIVLDLPACATGNKPAVVRGSRSEQSSTHQEVKSMLFADIEGYSKLTEKVIRDFVEVFMQRLSALLAESRYAPRSVNTWGDALYAVFDFAEEAGHFALELTKVIREGRDEWLQKGLFFEELDPATGKMVQRPLSVRVGLHTGPVFAHYNPILRQLGFTGSHVNRAARIEPVAASGEVYASEEFAAMAELGAQIKRRRKDSGSAEDYDGFVCEYAGRMPLAKNFPGRHRIYRVIAHRVLAIEELAKAAHNFYVEQQRARGETSARLPALLPWDELADDYKNANRAQVADIPNKLKLLGYELAPSHGIPASEIKITPAQLEDLSNREHQRWVAERESQGWSYGPVRENNRKEHPSLVPWEKLPESEKQKDRDAVANVPELIEHAGFRVRKLA